MVRKAWILALALLLAAPAALADSLKLELLDPAGQPVASETCTISDTETSDCQLPGIDSWFRSSCTYGVWKFRWSTTGTAGDKTVTEDISFDSYYNTVTGLPGGVQCPREARFLQDPADTTRFLACSGDSFSETLNVRWRVASQPADDIQARCQKEITSTESNCDADCRVAGGESGTWKLFPFPSTCTCERLEPCGDTECPSGWNKVGEPSCTRPPETVEGSGLAYAAAPGAFLAEPPNVNWPGSGDWTLTLLEPASGVSIRFNQSDGLTTSFSDDIIIATLSSVPGTVPGIKNVTGRANVSGPGTEQTVLRGFGCFDGLLEECSGNKSLVPHMAAAVGAAHAFETETRYCATDGDWTVDLDSKDIKSCVDAGFARTSTRCCSEADDPGEVYEDPAPPEAPERAGGCWFKQPVLHGKFPNASRQDKDESALLTPTPCANGSIDIGLFTDVSDNPPEARAQRICAWGVEAALIRGLSQLADEEDEVEFPDACPGAANPVAGDGIPRILDIHDEINHTPYLFCAAGNATIKMAEGTSPPPDTAAPCPTGYRSLGVLRERHNITFRAYRLCSQAAKDGLAKGVLDEVMSHLGEFHGCKPRPAVLAAVPAIQSDPECTTLASAFPPENNKPVHAFCRPDGIWDRTTERDPVTDAPLALVPSSIIWDPATPFPPAISMNGCCPSSKCWNGKNCTDAGRIFVVGSRAFRCQP
jgi:hypothetical protein